MPDNIFKKTVTLILKSAFGVKQNHSKVLNNPKKFLIVRQHNQFGDMLASVSLFRAVKESYPDATLKVIVSTQNYYAITKNKYIDEYFIFDKKKLFSFSYLKKLMGFLKQNYDVSIVPATVSISNTSVILGRLSDAKTRIGPEKLGFKENSLKYLCDRRIKLNWKKYPDAHVSDFVLDIVRPFGIKTNDYTSSISFDEDDKKTAEDFIKKIEAHGNPDADKTLIIGLHVGAGKPQNRWSSEKFAELINRLLKIYRAKLFLTGSSSDKTELEYVKNHLDFEIDVFMNKQIPELAAVISLCDLFVTNDTGVMHVAGTTKTKQVSIFGPTNPYNWAPLGEEKRYIRKSDLIDEISVDDVYKDCDELLKS